MKDGTVSIFIFYFLVILNGCTPLHIPFKSKVIRETEFREQFYYDEASATGFKKGWNWRLFSRQDARKFEKVQDKSNISAILKMVTPIYAAKRSSYDNTPEYLFVFGVPDSSNLLHYLSANYRRVNSFHDGMAFNFNNLKDKKVTLYFDHDTKRKTVYAYSVIRKTSNGQTFLSYYHATYKNLYKYLEQVYRWNSGKNFDKYIADNLENKSKAVPDSIVMLWPFASFNNVIQTIDKYDNFYSLNILKRPDSLLIVNGQLSYQAALESLTAAFQQEFFNEDKYVDLQVYAQTKAFYHTFLGQYKEAMDCEAMYKPINYAFSLKPSERVIDAAHFIMSKVSGQKIIAFNESHHDVRCRAFLLSFLDSLKTAGFTHLAIEDLNTAPTNGDVYFYTGYYCREPLMHNLIIEAEAKGFKIIPYDIANSKNKGKYIERDKIAAKKLLRKVNFHKGDRLVIFCGYGHIDKASDKSKPSSLMDYIKKYSGIEPYTIDLAYPRVYKIEDTIINHFYVLTDNQNSGYFHNKKGSNGDISVYPPSGKSYFDFDYYVSHGLLNYKKTVFNFVQNDAVEDSILSVYVYRTKEAIQDIRIALPVSTQLIKNCNQVITLYLPPYQKDYYLEVRTADNKLLIDRMVQAGAFQ